jgi:hypothetical protein
MALQKLTKIDGGGISTTSDYQVGVVTTRGIKGIGIFSGGSVVHSGVITALNFLGNGNSFAIGGEANGVVDINIAGDIDSGGTSEFNNINTLGIITASSGNFSGDVTIGGNLDVDGHTNLDNVSISGVTTIGNVVVGGATTDLIVEGNARVTGILSVGTGTVVIDETTVKTGTTNVHSVGVEVAGINVLGADTPIGTGATIYDAGGAVFTGVVTATSFSGDGSSLTGISADKIFEGNTKAEVSDSGSDGKFFVETEGTEKFSIDSSGINASGNLNVTGLGTFGGQFNYFGPKVSAAPDADRGISLLYNTSTASLTFHDQSGDGYIRSYSELFFLVDADQSTGWMGGGYGLRMTTGFPDTPPGSLIPYTISQGLPHLGRDAARYGNVFSEQGNYSGIVTATSFDGPSQIGIQSGGIQIGAGITQLNFVGTGNTFAVNGTTVDVSIAGGSGGGGGSGVSNDDSLSNVAFMHYGGFESDDSIKFPQKFHEIYSHEDAAVDIEDGVNVDIDLDCLLVISDKNTFDSFSNDIQKTNYLGSNGFKDNIRCVFDFNAELTALKKVGYVMIPEDYGDEVSCDIESGVTVSVGDMCVLNIGQ